jgi:tetratricopeptide (TPR) repeat protein
MRLAAWNGLATTLKHLSSFLPAREDSEEEARLYYRRACLAATEERYDVALIFCAKAVDLNPNDLATRLLIAQIHDYGLHDVNGAVDAYRKVISLAAYDNGNPYRAAAGEALDNLMRDREIVVESAG